LILKKAEGVKDFALASAFGTHGLRDYESIKLLLTITSSSEMREVWVR
jgi:hypothetical protein